MKRILLLLTAMTLITEIGFSQETKTVSNPTQHRSAMSIGGTYEAGFNVFGGNFKLDYLKKPKLGLGLKIAATPYGSNSQNNNLTESGFYLLSDLTATYYLVGNYSNSKRGIYTDFGFGYQSEKANSTRPINKEKFTARGLGGHATVGGNYKLGSGKIFVELMGGTILYGTYQKNSIYPVGYAGTITPNIKGKGSFIGDGFIGFNFGYCFLF